MTKQKLNRHLALLRQLEKNREQLVSMEAAGRADEAAGVRDDAISLNTAVLQSEAAITAWIATIGDSSMRMIFSLRFLCGQEWKTVAALIGDGGTQDGAKRRAYRYLEVHHDE